MWVPEPVVFGGHTPAVREEAPRLLEHIDQHRGVINASDTRFAFRRVSLDHLPSGWAEEARGIFTAWRPYAHTGNH
ncbi:hypothetical protein ACIQCG_13295 [Streptomyces noursei]|uniref:hypothetical protein n=1 Tax=Streptomyces noursei TaxID=1971 RepID=UPI0037F95DC6